MIPSLSFTGGSASAESSAKVGTLGQDTSSSAAGNRGFINNAAFPGATLNADQGINGPALDPAKWGQWTLLGLGALLLFGLWRRVRH